MSKVPVTDKSTHQSQGLHGEEKGWFKKVRKKVYDLCIEKILHLAWYLCSYILYSKYRFLTNHQGTSSHLSEDA